MLPETLLIRVLAASEDTCVELISKLPPQLHRAALHAKYPSIQSHGTLKVSWGDLCSCGDQWSMLDVATAAPRIETLVLSRDRCWPSTFLRVPLQGLTALTSLTLNGIPADLRSGSWVPSCSLPSLRHLEVRNFHFDKFTFYSLSHLLSSATGLEYLDTQFRSISHAIEKRLIRKLQCLKSLKHLDLDVSPGPWLTRLASLSKLTFLSMSFEYRVAYGRCLNRNEMDELLSSLPNLRHLHISLNSKGDYIFSSLGLLTGLKRLDINRSIHGEGLGIVRAAASALHMLTQLTHLMLDGSWLNADALEVLGPALTNLSLLQVLNLNATAMEHNGVLALLPYLQVLTSLHSLWLERMPLSTEGADAIGKYLRDHSPPLQHLVLSYVCTRGEASPALAAARNRLSLLTALEMRSFCFGEEGTAANVSQLLSVLSCLCALDLSKSQMGDHALSVLAPAIGGLSALEVLDLSENNMQPAGIESLAPHLGKLSSLRILDLGDNPWAWQGAGGGLASLCTHLWKLPKLRQLTLRDCWLEKQKLRPLAMLMKHNTALKLVDLGNAFTAYTRQDLVSAGFEQVEMRTVYRHLKPVLESNERTDRLHDVTISVPHIAVCMLECAVLLWPWLHCRYAGAGSCNPLATYFDVLVNAACLGFAQVLEGVVRERLLKLSLGPDSRASLMRFCIFVCFFYVLFHRPDWCHPDWWRILYFTVRADLLD